MRRLSSTQIIAIVLFSTYDKRPTMKELAEKLAGARNAGLDMGDIDVRKTDNGYYSERLEEYLDALKTFGFIAEKSPLVVKDTGLNVIDQTITDARRINSAEVDKWLKFLRQGT